MRKAMIGAGVVVLARMLVGVAAAGGGPRLDGTFKVTGTVTGTDINGLSPGAHNKDTFTFAATCPSGGCPKVKLTRDAGGRNVKSTLKRVKPGVYKGDEGPVAYTCVSPLGDPGSFTGNNKIKVTKTDHGKATAISGTSKIKFKGCDETFENTKIKGTLK